MTRSRDPFFQALDSLRLRAEQGVYGAGRPVVIVDEARRLRLSATPVREALAWMAGAGLVERAPLGGYVTLQLDAAAVRDALGFRLHCLSLGLEASGAFPVAWPEEEIDARTVLDRRLARLVQSSGSAALFDAYRRVSARLTQIGAAEARVFGDLDEEAEGLAQLLSNADAEAAWAGLARYHHRRMDAAAVLVLEAASRPLQDGEGGAP